MCHKTARSLGKGRRFSHSPKSVQAFPSSEFHVLCLLEIYSKVKAGGPKFVHCPLSSAKVQNKSSCREGGQM